MKYMLAALALSGCIPAEPVNYHQYCPAKPFAVIYCDKAENITPQYTMRMDYACRYKAVPLSFEEVVRDSGLVAPEIGAVLDHGEQYKIIVCYQGAL